MNCPKCGSDKTEKIKITATDWKIGLQRCMTCKYKAHWSDFCTSSQPVKKIKNVK